MQSSTYQSKGAAEEISPADPENLNEKSVEDMQNAVHARRATEILNKIHEQNLIEDAEDEHKFKKLQELHQQYLQAQLKATIQTDRKEGDNA